MKKQKIIFTASIDIDKNFYPEPAINNIPDWYKKINSYIGSKTFKVDGHSGNQTIKKCMPVFDAITAGYIIKSYTDIYVEKNDENGSYYSWPLYEPILFHPIEQAKIHPNANGMDYPKWSNPWSIKTPKGYSTLFTNPMHNPNGIFTIMPGIVDTDSYINPVNFPFTLNDPNFEGIIPAGTAIAQVIPFKRDYFKMKIGNKKHQEGTEFFKNTYSIKWVNNYKTRFWNKKQYK